MVSLVLFGFSQPSDNLLLTHAMSHVVAFSYKSYSIKALIGLDETTTLFWLVGSNRVGSNSLIPTTATARFFKTKELKTLHYNNNTLPSLTPVYQYHHTSRYPTSTTRVDAGGADDDRREQHGVTLPIPTQRLATWGIDDDGVGGTGDVFPSATTVASSSSTL